MRPPTCNIVLTTFMRTGEVNRGAAEGRAPKSPPPLFHQNEYRSVSCIW
jgi:hypothetical protein